MLFHLDKSPPTTERGIMHWNDPVNAHKRLVRQENDERYAMYCEMTDEEALFGKRWSHYKREDVG